MRIAIIAHSFYPIAEPFAGGLEMITCQLVRELIARGHEVDLYAHPESCPSLSVVPMLTVENVLNRFNEDEIVYAGMEKGEFAQTFIYHDVMARIFSGEYDIVHNHSLHHVPIIVGNLLGKKFITSVHTPAFIQLKFGFSSLPVVHQTTTAVSNRQRELFSTTAVIGHTIYNGIDLDRWPPNFGSTGDYYFWMGRMCAEKAPHHAIEACLRSGKRLLLAGPISNREYFEQHVKPYLNKENIEYLGHLTHEEIAPVLRQAVGYLFTSVWEEPYGLTIAESLACGTPVIAYRVGAAPEIITEGTGLLIDKGDVAGLTKAMQSVRHIDRRSCRQHAENFCSAKTMADNYLALYEKVSDSAPLKPLLTPSTTHKTSSLTYV